MNNGKDMENTGKTRKNRREDQIVCKKRCPGTATLDGRTRAGTREGIIWGNPR